MIEKAREIIKHAASAGNASLGAKATETYEDLSKRLKESVADARRISEPRKAFIRAGVSTEFLDAGHAKRFAVESQDEFRKEGSIPTTRLAQLNNEIKKLRDANPQTLEDAWEDFVECLMPEQGRIVIRKLARAFETSPSKRDQTKAKKAKDNVGRINDIEKKRPTPDNCAEIVKELRKLVKDTVEIRDAFIGDNDEVQTFVSKATVGVPLSSMTQSVWDWLEENHLEDAYVVSQPR